VTETSDLRTGLSSYDLHHIWLRGLDLTGEIMGHRTFAEVVYLLITGELPAPQDRVLLDATLVALMDHGLTASAVVARATYWAAPEAMQAAVAAGLLGAGSRVLGSMEECGQILTQIDTRTEAGEERSRVIDAIIDDYRGQRRHLPGIGHPIHTEGDPRAARLLEIAADCGRTGRHVAAMHELHERAEARIGRRLPLNVTGAIAAVLLELGIPWQLHRGFALISRAAGLVAHVGEERWAPITPALRSELFRAGRQGPAEEKPEAE
jgi:citrate synthase